MRPHILAKRPHRIRNQPRRIPVPPHKFRRRPKRQVQNVVKHQHLPVAFWPGANPNRRSADLRRDHRCHFARNPLDKKTRHPRAIQSHGIAHELLDRAQALPLHLVPAHHVDRLRRQPNVPRDWNLSVNNLPDQLRALFPTLDLDDFGPAFLHETRGISNGVLGINLIRPVRHVRHQHRTLHAAPHRLHMVQHLVHGDRERVLVAEHGLRQRIPHQHHIDASLVH